MSNGKIYGAPFRAMIVKRVKAGESRVAICEEYEIPRSTLSNWISQADPSHPRANPITAREIRTALEMYDGEVHIADVIRLSGRSEKIVLQWIEDPKYREATFEYDPDVDYDYHDLIDRSVVTHYLCTQTPFREDRLELVAALTNPSVLDAA